MAGEGMCREGAAHFKSQSDANAVLYHSFSATDADAAAFSSAGTNAQKICSGTSALVRTPTNIHSHASYPKITFIVSCQIYSTERLHNICSALLCGFLALQLSSAQKHMWMQIWFPQ